MCLRRSALFVARSVLKDVQDVCDHVNPSSQPGNDAEGTFCDSGEHGACADAREVGANAFVFDETPPSEPVYLIRGTAYRC